MTKRSFYFFATCALAIVVSACTNASSEASTALDAESAFALFTSEGLSCGCMAVLRALPEAEADEFRAMVWETMSVEQVAEAIEHREPSCASNRTGEIGSIDVPITGTYSVEQIEETSGSGGVQPVAILVDGAAYGNMCGTDGDYIAEFDNVSGAYASLSSLRIRGTNFFASCYLSNPTAARVYSDNDIRACIGYWSVFFCGAVSPLAGEIRVWVN